MPRVLGPVDFGQLILFPSSTKCLNLNPIMLRVFGPDDLGQLTLFPSSTKCLNLNPIIPRVLEPDDLGQLTLVLSFIKCLNLNSIMTEVLGPDDLGQLTLILSFFKYLNLNLSILLKIPIQVSCIYCYPVTIEYAYSIYALTQVLNLFSWTYLIICSILPSITIHTIQIKGRWHQNNSPLFIMTYEIKGAYFH